MTDRNLEHRKNELMARRARLSAAKLAELEQRLQGDAPPSSVPAIPHIRRDGPLPLSLAQQRLWFLEQLAPSNTAYNVPMAVRLSGELEVTALEHSLNVIIQRHETLRTTIVNTDGQPQQIIAPQLMLEMTIVDLRDRPEIERERQLQLLAQAEAAQPFDLARGPLWRVVLVHLQPAEHVLLLTLHHLISDGWSMGVLVREIVTCYTARRTGQAGTLPELPLQYADYAAWQRSWFTGDVLTTQVNYWVKQLRDPLPVLELPTDRPRPAQQTFSGATQNFVISAAVTEELKSLSRQAGVTLFMTLLASFQTLLYRYSGQTDLIIGTPIANRARADLEGLIGFFVNTLALRVDLAGNPSFMDLLGRVREVTLGAYAHQDLPFDRLVEELHLPRDLSRTPVFQVVFALQNMPGASIELSGLKMAALEVDSGTAKFDLTLMLTESPEGLRGACEYNTDLFEAATIERMIAHFQILLASSVLHPDWRLSQLPWLSESELHQVLIGWNDTHVASSSARCVTPLIEEQTIRLPDAIAVVAGDEHLTYRELNRRANQVAHYLQTLGVGPEVLVGVCLERSVEMIIALLGCLKAGGAYVPLDPAYPPERLAYMLNDSGAAVLVTHSHLATSHCLTTVACRQVCVDTEGEAIALQPDSALPNQTSLDQLAYVIYTSGSTGQPKGVLIEHVGLMNLVLWHQRVFELSSQDRATQLAGLSFDASVWEIWPYLTAGASLHLLDEETRLSPERLQAWLVAHAITIGFLPTPLAESMVAQSWPAATPLRLILTGGDKLHTHPAADLSFFLINNYGPTENTVVTTSSPIAARTANGLIPTIGRPIDNVQVYVLDAHLNPVPIGVPGELYIGGISLARGYLKRPELTADKFVPNPYSTLPGSRLYRTGDVVRYRSNGDLEFLGRSDQQVKVRGFRIELGEIEAVLRQHPAVQEGVVLARADQSGNNRLVAYLVLNTTAANVGDVRQYLHAKLPGYMVPAAFVVLEALPLTPNGKIDRRRLLSQGDTEPDSSTVLVAPRDVVEIRLVQLWEDLLNARPIGIQHNFFELGGHSLLAVQLIAHIQREWGYQLPIAALFQGATIEKLAALLRQNIQSTDTTSVMLQAGKADQLPLFLVHPGSGHVTCYVDLAHHLDPDRPCYALQARGLVGEQEPETQIEAMAQHYVAEIQTVQPHGPYLLGGWSFGGVVAFEMAQQLHQQGQEVARLILLDSYVPNDTALPTDDLIWLAAFAQDLGISWRSVSFDREYLMGLDSDARLAYLLDQAQRAEVIPTSVELAQIRQLFHVFQCHVEAVQHYRPQAYPGPIIFFKANDALSETPPTPESDWGELARGGLDVRTAPGSHYTILREPNVRSLAEQLNQQLPLTQEIS